MNYTQLTTAIKGFAENDFPATVGSFTSAEQIARFVQLAEQRIYNMVQLPAIRKTNYAVELHYFYYPESIVTAGTTWLGTNFDSALLYGSLLEAALFMKSDADTMTVYKARYDDAMAELKQLGDGKNRQDAYRSGQVRYPVR